jgi:hypothetical protein
MKLGRESNLLYHSFLLAPKAVYACEYFYLLHSTGKTTISEIKLDGKKKGVLLQHTLNHDRYGGRWIRAACDQSKTCQQLDLWNKVWSKFFFFFLIASIILGLRFNRTRASPKRKVRNTSPSNFNLIEDPCVYDH